MKGTPPQIVLDYTQSALSDTTASPSVPLASHEMFSSPSEK